MKEILIITNYFPPESGAASNRIAHMAEGFHARGFKVTVVTPMPNYPYGKIFKDYRGSFTKTSIENGIKIVRLRTYASNSKSALKRLFAMMSYSFRLMFYFLFHRIPKTVLIQSPPLLVAYTSIFFLRSKRRKLILNVSDLWPLAGKELGVLKEGRQYSLLEKIERFNYRNADMVLGQSQEILEHVKPVAQTDDLFLYRNFPKIDTPFHSAIPHGQKLKIVYAGLLGVAQGIVKLCSELEYDGVEFHIYGAGAEQQQLEAFIKSNPDKPIFYHNEIYREELHKRLPDYDLVIIPLLNRIYGSVPSKVFEYGKLGMPMIYFGGGEGESVIREFDLGWVAEVGNYSNLNNTIRSISKENLTIERRKKIAETAQREFNFDHQFDDLIERL